MPRFTLLVRAIIRLQELPPIQSNALFFFSKISYSLYLVHMLFVASTIDLLNSTIHLRSMPIAQQVMIFSPVYCVFSILAALALHYTVEKPFLILKDRLGQSPTAQTPTSRGLAEGRTP